MSILVQQLKGSDYVDEIQSTKSHVMVKRDSERQERGLFLLESSDGNGGEEASVNHQ